MRKISVWLVVMSMVSLIGIGSAFSQESDSGKNINEMGGNKQAQTAFKRALQIKQEMGEIAKQTVENDKELVALREKIRTLSQELRDKLKEKLENNDEYQSLKKEAQGMLNRLKESQEDNDSQE